MSYNSGGPGDFASLQIGLGGATAQDGFRLFRAEAISALRPNLLCPFFPIFQSVSIKNSSRPSKYSEESAFGFSSWAPYSKMPA